MKKEVAISVVGVSKHFELPHEKTTSIKSGVLNVFRKKGKSTVQHVLKDISFEVEKGDFFGIVGRNGSGKSTLLKIIAEIYKPSKGKVSVDGKLVPFIELGVGFNPELTGRENIYLNGALLGFTRQQMDGMYEEIVGFAELEGFMDQKLKNYSSGMQVRLAFSIAIRAKADILVLDEVLAVGDEAFQRKCYQYFAQIKKQKRTVILVTHNMDTVLQFCNKALLVDKGHKTELGDPLHIAQIYRNLNATSTKSSKKGEITRDNKDVNAVVRVVTDEKKISFDVVVDPGVKSKMIDPVITFVINRDDGEVVYRWVTDEKITKDISITRKKPFKLHLKIENIFPDGLFDVQLGIKRRDRSIEYAMFDSIARFEIINQGSFVNDVHWKPREEFHYE